MIEELAFHENWKQMVEELNNLGDDAPKDHICQLARFTSQIKDEMMAAAEMNDTSTLENILVDASYNVPDAKVLIDARVSIFFCVLRQCSSQRASHFVLQYACSPDI